MDRKISILGCNAYLLPSLMVNENNRTCTNQASRASGIARLARDFDIVALQEVWGSSVDILFETLRVNHFVHNEISPVPLVGGWLASVANTISYYFKSIGGLWTVWNQVCKHLDPV